MPNDRDRQTKIDKLDKIMLINLDRGGEEILDKTDEMIEANTKVLIRRVPMKEMEPIEL